MLKTEMEQVDAVVYTDGSARPQNGFGGWGVHAIPVAEKVDYAVKELEDEESPLYEKLAFDMVYVAKKVPPKGWDKITGDTPATGPCVTHFAPEKFIDLYGPIAYPTTNNFGELMAGLKAIELIKKQGWKSVVILADSRYVLNGIKKVRELEDTSVFKKDDGSWIPNGELWVKVFHAFKELEATGAKTDWLWVRGHNGVDGNEAADANSKRGRALSTNNKLELDFEVEYLPADYGKAPKEKCLSELMQKHWYFLPHEPLKIQDRPLYFFGDHGKEDDLMGKPRSESRLNVVCLKEPDPVLEKIMDRLKENKFASQFVHVGKADLLMSPKIREEIKTNGTDYFYWEDRTGELKFFNDRTMAVVRNPALKAYRAYSALTILAEKLEAIMAGKIEDMVRLDITDLLFTKNDKGKLIVDPLLGSVNKSIRVTIPTVKKDVTLTVGIDIPTRNGLSRLAGENPTVELFWHSTGSHTGRYFTYVKGDHSDSLWSAYQSNLTLKT